METRSNGMPELAPAARVMRLRVVRRLVPAFFCTTCYSRRRKAIARY